jgi:uncharacterized membrane protein
MSINKKLLSATLVVAAAAAFATVPVTSALAEGASSNVKCYGVNACKGQSECKTASSGCKGQNTCKGQGFKEMSEEQCKSKGGQVSESKE